ncbi:hypothetical protein GCM10010279_01170 [Streptomyces mutabilis]|nr:hypothetical protein GCM10010279_01170 [Streptomyces mutabilis]
MAPVARRAGSSVVVGDTDIEWGLQAGSRRMRLNLVCVCRLGVCTLNLVRRGNYSVASSP